MPATAPPTEATALLRWLADREAIRDLISSFGVSVDDKDSSTYTENFTEDAVLELPFGRFEGRQTIADMKGPPSHWRTQHLFGNIVIDLDGDTASARANSMATHVFDPQDATTKAHSGGWYTFTAARTSTGWRLAHVVLTLVWQDERPMLPAGVGEPPPHPVAAQ